MVVVFFRNHEKSNNFREPLTLRAELPLHFPSPHPPRRLIFPVKTLSTPPLPFPSPFFEAGQEKRVRFSDKRVFYRSLFTIFSFLPRVLNSTIEYQPCLRIKNMQRECVFVKKNYSSPRDSVLFVSLVYIFSFWRGI